jgi:uncharacterized ion transporter superfamily protein YfcC
MTVVNQFLQGLPPFEMQSRLLLVPIALAVVVITILVYFSSKEMEEKKKKSFVFMKQFKEKDTINYEDNYTDVNRHKSKRKKKHSRNVQAIDYLSAGSTKSS